MKNIKNQIRILLASAAFLLLTGCGVNWHLSTVNHDPVYGTVYVSDDVKVDTLNYTQFKRKLRTDFSFRWDYANYMMNQPLSFYYRNYPVIWVMFTIFGGTQINTGQTGHLITLSLHSIHGTGTDGTHGQDGDGIAGGVTAVAGMQILGITTGINMDILAGMDMTRCYGELNGDIIM